MSDNFLSALEENDCVFIQNFVKNSSEEIIIKNLYSVKKFPQTKATEIFLKNLPTGPSQVFGATILDLFLINDLSKGAHLSFDFPLPLGVWEGVSDKGQKVLCYGYIQSGYRSPKYDKLLEPSAQSIVDLTLDFVKDPTKTRIIKGFLDNSETLSHEQVESLDRILCIWPEKARTEKIQVLSDRGFFPRFLQKKLKGGLSMDKPSKILKM